MKYCLLLILIVIFGCDKSDKLLKQFSRLPSSHTNIDFVNTLEISEDFDVFRYRNYYNGGGVAIGDINNDGLPDIFLTSNMGPNKLYLNKGNFQFEDITDLAGVGGNKSWSTGVSMVDINGNGLLDIYVCNSGDIKGGRRENELFINNGDLTFTESAAEFGLDDKGFSTHAVFFDYDQDGDLDCYLLNNSFRPVSSLGYENIRHVRDSTGGDKLLKNNNGKFEDVSEDAGIYGSVIGFGLGVTITDVNGDGWMDLYVSNDFFERDYLYINQKDGTFSEELTSRMGHISNFSMGADAADLDNDGFPEIYVTDMLPESEIRMKTMVNHESYNVHQIRLENDYYHQYMRNTLQLNRGDGTFSEIGQYAGVHATDWSWGALIADFDNDLNKEIFVTNGIYKDVIDQDFINYLASEDNMIAAMRKQTVDFRALVEKMPSSKLSNFLFKKKQRHLTFENKSADWGLDEPSFSNGAAYGDLDNDGDLDLVVNNVNQELFIYRNESDQLSKNNYLKLSFKGPGKNTFGVGAKVCAYIEDQIIMLENVPTKGFQSSMDYSGILGLGKNTLIDSLKVFWGYGKTQTLYEVEANQQLELNYSDAWEIQENPGPEAKPVFQKSNTVLNPPFRHLENTFVDFNRESLLYHKLSTEGPALTVADVNNDGLDDFYIGGASGQPGMLYLQKKDGGFEAVIQPEFEKDKHFEDVDAVFFDANGDGKPDLYVVSGGYVHPENTREYQDRLYLFKEIKGGEPVYERAVNALPSNFTMGSCVRPADFNGDGHIDLFVGGRAIPGKYGMPPSSSLLLNDGKGNFTEASHRLAPQFSKLGMVTDAIWVDYDNDGDLDLVVVGDWMPLVIFKNNGTNLERLNNVPGLTQTEGFWKSIDTLDIDNDGNIDFIAGNLGLNSRYKASKEEPLTLFVNDFDNNGSYEPIYAQYENGNLFPMALRHNLINQLPYLKKDYLFYKDYAGKTVQDIFSEEQLAGSIENKIHQLASVVFRNIGDGSFEMQKLPEEVQFSPVFSMVSGDFSKNGQQELLLTGNFFGTKPEEGRYDANKGTVLQKDKDGFKVISFKKSGLNILGEVRKVAVAKAASGKHMLIIAKNNDELEIYEY